MVRGPTPTTTKLTTVIAPAVTSAEVQPRPKVSTATNATRVVATSSHASRSNNSRLMWRGRSAATACSAAAPQTPSWARAPARAAETVPIAASAIATPPASTTRPAAHNSRARSGNPPVAAGSISTGPRQPPALQQAALQPEHLAFLLRLGVVIAEQMQDTVHGQQFQLLEGSVAGHGRLPSRHLRTQHDVAQESRLTAVLPWTA